MKNTKIDEKIDHHDTEVTKKIKLKEINKNTIKKLIEKKDVTIEECYFFNKKLSPDNVKTINYLSFDYLIKDNDPNISLILIKNVDETYNRETLKKFESLALKNVDLKFYHMYNTDKNIEYLKSRFDIDADNISFPQLLIIKDKRHWLFPNTILLKYSVTSEDLNAEMKKFKQKI